MKKGLKVLLSFLLAFLVFMPNNMSAAEEGWVPKASLLQNKDEMSLVSLNGKIYSIGGVSKGTYLKNVDEYDPITDKWIAKSLIPTTAKANASAVALNGKIYITGGSPGRGSLTKTMEIYDPVSDSWTKGTDLPVTVAGHSTQVVNGKIILAGGFTTFNNSVTSTYEYDPLTEKWTTKANMFDGRRYTTSAYINNEIYVIGGYKEGTGILSSVESYDAQTDTWTKRASLSKGRAGLAATQFNGKIYTIGGNTAVASVSGPGSAQVDIYDPQNNIWNEGPTLSIPRGYLAATVLGNKLYVAGGSNNSTYYNTFEMLDLTSTLPPVIEEPTTPPGTEEPTTPPGTEEPTTPPGTGEPTTPNGDRAILVIIMNNGLEKEYDLSMAEVNAFTTWYDAKDAGTGPSRFVIDKHFNNKGPFSKRTDSVIFNNILTFEISEYTFN